ncbi:MAG: O-antigen ligase family protein, partial [Bacteroidales bacterium]
TFKTDRNDAATTKSNDARWLIWQAGLAVVKENPILGVGTGDVKDALIDEYAKRQMLGAIEKKLNAHNQFLETAVGQGIIGILVFLFVFLIPFIKALKEKNIVWMLFLLLISFNFLFESMLNTQMGVFFFAYFYSFFIFEHKLKKT